MPDVDLNQKVWGVKAQTHFYGFSVIYVMISFINLVSIIDIMALPSKEKDKYGITGYSYLGDIPITMVCACFILLILFCIRIKTFYGILAVLLIFISSLMCFNGCLDLLMPKPTIPFLSLFQAEMDKVQKYYKYSLIARSIAQIFSSFAKIYLGVVLLKLSFCAPRPVIYVNHRRRSRSDLERSGGDKEEEVDEDIEEKPRSKKKEVENEKSGNSGNSGNSKSGNSKSGTGKSEKSGKTGNSGN